MNEISKLLNSILIQKQCTDEQFTFLLSKVTNKKELWYEEVKFDIVQEHHQRWLLSNGFPPTKWIFQDQSFGKDIMLKNNENFFYCSSVWLAVDRSNCNYKNVSHIYLTNECIYIEWGLIFKKSKVIPIDRIEYCERDFLPARNQLVQSLIIKDMQGEETVLYDFPSCVGLEIKYQQRDCTSICTLLNYYLNPSYIMSINNDNEVSDFYAKQHPNNDKRFARILELGGEYTQREITFAYKQLSSRIINQATPNLFDDRQLLSTKRILLLNEAYSYFRQKYNF